MSYKPRSKTPIIHPAIAQDPTAQAAVRDWISALRSGEYEQCSGALHLAEADGGGYCCLGVALDLLMPSGWGDLKSTFSNKMGALHALSVKSPQRQLYYPGTAARDQLYLTLAGMKRLAQWNDNGEGFAFIADQIENSLGDALA